MKNRMLTLIATLGLAAALAPTAAAQVIDMSWATQSAVGCQTPGDAYARAVAQNYYNYLKKLPEAGYSGPSLPGGVDANAIKKAMQAAEEIMACRQSGSGDKCAWRTKTAADDNYRSIQHCQIVAKADGSIKYVCAP